MLSLDAWLVPHLDRDHEHFTKPPLTYWAIAGSLRLFGSNEWAARLPNALAFVLTGLLVFGLARRTTPDHPGLGALVWATMLGPVAGSQRRFDRHDPDPLGDPGNVRLGPGGLF